jgi:hypothetical protein
MRLALILCALGWHRWEVASNDSEWDVCKVCDENRWTRGGDTDAD